MSVYFIQLIYAQYHNNAKLNEEVPKRPNGLKETLTCFNHTKIKYKSNINKRKTKILHIIERNGKPDFFSQ